ncbi:DJ-1/PfpI family protein [Methanorbis rubei]|uniref:Cysteine protease YraA n=1 Tax=Methanorbis rubei TaxID=3028300 RepID=A0AAE4MGE9_9EURY|nr:putative cysteine protease YraA [Methanocorpusculaceae archaeon Cs1]
MKILFAIAPDRFLDQEYTVPKSLFEEKGIACITASTIKGTCYGMHGEIVETDMSFDDVNTADYDGIVVVGGIGCQDYLWRCEKLIDIVNKFGNEGKVTAAICLAPAIIAEAGLLAGKNATILDTPASRRLMTLDKAVLVNEPVVISGKIITARMPQDSKAFAEAVVANL